MHAITPLMLTIISPNHHHLHTITSMKPSCTIISPDHHMPAITSLEPSQASLPTVIICTPSHALDHKHLFSPSYSQQYIYPPVSTVMFAWIFFQCFLIVSCSKEFEQVRSVDEDRHGRHHRHHDVDVEEESVDHLCHVPPIIDHLDCTK